MVIEFLGKVELVDGALCVIFMGYMLSLASLSHYSNGYACCWDPIGGCG